MPELAGLIAATQRSSSIPSLNARLSEALSLRLSVTSFFATLRSTIASEGIWRASTRSSVVICNTGKHEDERLDFEIIDARKLAGQSVGPAGREQAGSSSIISRVDDR